MTGCGSDWPQVGRCCWGGGGVGLSCCPQQRDLEAAQEVADVGQDRSLTHFYSVRYFTIKDQCKKSAFTTNGQSRIASVVLEGFLGPLRLAEFT